MKKLILLATVVFGLTTMNAQKNSILVGGNVGYNHSKVEQYGNSQELDSYSITPYVGYQFTDHWTVAANGSFSKDDKGNYNNKGTKIGGFVRYNVPFNDTFALNLDAGAGWQRYTYYSNTSNEYKANGYYIGFTPSLFINFKNSFGLNFSIGGIEYNDLKVKDTNLKGNSLDITFGNAFNIGISKNFKF